MATAFSQAERARISAQLKETGLRLFTTLGLKKTSLADLTAPAGIVKSTFYLFFDSKEALYLELMLERVADTRRQTIDEGLRLGTDTRDALRRYLRGAVRVLRTDPLYRRLVSHPEEIAMVQRKLTPERLAQAGDNGMAELTAFVAERQAAGELVGDDPSVLVSVLRTVLLIPLHETEYGDNYPQVLDTTIDALVTGLTGTGAPATDRP